MSEHEAGEGYEGEVTVAADGVAPCTASAALAARFDPLAGRGQPGSVIRTTAATAAPSPAT
jgi:hypothetical protein